MGPRDVPAHAVRHARDPPVHLRVLAEDGVLQDREARGDEVLLLLPYLALDDVEGGVVRQALVVLEDAEDVRVVRVRHLLLRVREEVVHEPDVIYYMYVRASASAS